MREKSRTLVEAEGAALLARDARLACRPRQHAGETERSFVERMALHYGISIEEVCEILGL
jgi:hypothetical protein